MQGKYYDTSLRIKELDHVLFVFHIEEKVLQIQDQELGVLSERSLLPAIPLDQNVLHSSEREPL